MQTFVPVQKLEDALLALDAYLPSQELKRIDTRQGVRHHADEEWDELPDDYYRDPLEEAARTGECVLGVFIVSQDTAWPRDSLV